MTKSQLVENFTNGIIKGTTHNAKLYSPNNVAEKETALRLHHTDIVRVVYRSSNIGAPTPSRMYFNTGGWYTPTTKSYMNLVLKAVSSYGIYQKQGAWFFSLNNSATDMHGFARRGEGSIKFDNVEYLDLESGCLKIKAECLPK